MHEVPLAAYDTGADDGERFLHWLEGTCRPGNVQRDYIACQRCRNAVERLARTNRLSYLQFQDLLGLAPELADELETNHTLAVHLNPIRVWAQFETRELLDETATLPAEVVFFPVAGDILTAVLEDEGLERVTELAASGPCTIDDWLSRLEHYAHTDRTTRDDLVALCRDLTQMGLVALG